MAMPAVSQALVEFANHRRPQPEPGTEVIVTRRYLITLQPDFPIPGPNSVSFIRCRHDEADEVIREARATIAPLHLPVMWTLDPETVPPDFADDLARHGSVLRRSAGAASFWTRARPNFPSPLQGRGSGRGARREA